MFIEIDNINIKEAKLEDIAVTSILKKAKITNDTVPFTYQHKDNIEKLLATLALQWTNGGNFIPSPNTSFDPVLIDNFKTKSNIKVYNTCAGPNYVSQNADVRPDNFGTHKIKDTKSKLYEDLEMFMDKPEDLASSLLDMGIKSMKIWPFDFAKGATTGLEISNYDLKKYIQPFERIRKAHGSNIKIKAELHGIWGLEASKKICKALEDYDMCWIEDPIWMDRLDDIPKLAMTTDQPLAGGETLGGLGQIRQLIEISDIAYPIIDVTWGGGITFAKKAAALAESHMKSIAFHDCSGPITLAVSTHLALACSNVIEQEITRGFYYGWYHELVTELPIIENGMISVSNKPGLGMDLSNNLLKKSDIIIRETI